MEVSTFNDKRILTMLNQSYNFDYILVADLANEAMKRKLISVVSHKELIAEHELIRKEKLESNYQRDQQMNMGEIDNSNRFSNFFFIVMPIIILIGSFIIYLLTDWILIFGLGTLTASGTYLSKRRFKS